jgi:RNA polymerase sigma-70 factor (ECF subfamily)
MADAEDVAQGVFLRLGSGNAAAMTNAGSYLYRAAINGALDLLRRRKAAATEPLECAAAMASTEPGASPETTISSHELGVHLRQAISELAPRAAEMFALRYLEELENREIAKLMGTSSAVVAVTLHQARSKLKKRLTELQRGTR